MLVTQWSQNRCCFTVSIFQAEKKVEVKDNDVFTNQVCSFSRAFLEATLSDSFIFGQNDILRITHSGKKEGETYLFNWTY